MKIHPFRVLAGKRNPAALTIGLVLILYIGFLIVSNYLSQVELQKTALEKLRQDTEKLAMSVSYFCAERKIDLKNLSENRVVSVYFENKSLGMSMEYGLKASLNAIIYQFDRLMEEKKFGGKRIYPRVTFIRPNGELLVDTGLINLEQDQGRDWNEFLTPDGRDVTFIDKHNPQIPMMIVTIPYFFKGNFAGQFVAWINFVDVYEHLVKKGGHSNGHTSFVSIRDHLQSAEYMRARFSPLSLSEIMNTEMGKTRRLEVTDHTGIKRDMIVIRVPIKETPLSLTRVMPASDILGRSSPFYLLVATAVLSIAVLIGMMLFWRVTTNNLVLEARFEEASKRRQEIEEKNRQLEQEINERKQAEELLRKAHDELERRVKERTAELMEANEQLKGEIEEHKRAEEEKTKLRSQLQQAQKMEAIGILAGGIAHDFNNLLTIILGNIQLAEDDIKPEVGISECLAEAEKASIQAQALTRKLITFAKGGAPVKKIGSIGNLVKETTDYSLSGSNVKCDFLILHDLWPVEFDEGQMEHTINNMIVNAVESMQDEGTIHVRAENINITAEQGLPLLEGKYVKISIRDHGVGIPEKHLSKIFDPYFSTKEMGIQKGMGLGLATTYSIINRHDGYITVESEVGVGTTFTLFLPAREKDIRELEPVKILEPEKPSIRTGRILVMDDEESIRKLSKKRLSQLGYESELTKDGAQAIELYKKAMDSGQPFDAVILDLTVKGGMGGKDAVKALLKIDPQVKAIVSSGYSNDPVMTDFRTYGFTGALPKPNTKKELIAVLKNIIKK